MVEIDSDITGMKTKPETRILIVDDEPSISALLADMLGQGGYSCTACGSGEEAVDMLTAERFAAIFSDLRMPGMSGLELLHFVRRAHSRLAFVMVTGVDDAHVAVQAMKEGADDYLLKPVTPAAMLVSVDQVLRQKEMEAELENYRFRLEDLVEERTAELQKAMQRLEQAHDDTSQALAAALDLRDNDTAGHSWHVRAYALEIAKAMGCGPEELDDIARGALLHDIGKIGIPDAVLMKPGKLSDQERTVMMTHVGIGYYLLSHFEFLEGAAKVVLTHHERFDGKGYPQGLAGEEIPLGARIFAVADTLDSMTSDRPYRAAMSFAAAYEEILRESGKQFDPQVVSAFLSVEEARWNEIRTESETIRCLSLELALVPMDHAVQTVAVRG